MNTKRCPSCQKLLRADTESCNRCGYTFSQSKPTPKPTTPPASPHRAGHYSGLHPEDQPYQSSVMLVQPALLPPAQQRGSAQATARLRQEPARLLLPTIEPAPSIPEAPQLPILYRQTTVTPPELQSYIPPPEMPDRAQTPGRTLTVILAIACILLLIAGSILTFLFLHPRPPSAHQPLFSAQPNQGLRANDTFTLLGSGFAANDPVNFTRDVNQPIFDSNKQPLRALTDSNGSFYIGIIVPDDWEAGSHYIFATDEKMHFSIPTMITIAQPRNAPPQLYLSKSSIDLGADLPGAISNKSITLINAGGGQLSWQASSNQSWLTVTPYSGSFSGSATVQLTVNRGSLSPQPYNGQVTFTQLNGSPALAGNTTPSQFTLTVTMAVRAAPASASANLVLLPATLSYSSTNSQSPGDQTITLLNGGAQAIDWTTTLSTGDGHPWLTISPGSGHVAPGVSDVVKVSVNTQNLAVGTYQGTIIFTGGENPQVTVNLTVVAPGDLSLSRPSLNLQTIQGQSPASQSLNVQDSGGQPLDWKAATSDSAKWLSITPSNGHLDPNAQMTLTINANTTALKAGSYNETVNFTYGTTSKQFPVSLTVSPPPAAIIDVQPATLSFNVTQGSDPTPQTLTIANTGNATLHWSLKEDANGTSDAPAAPATGSLDPTKSAPIKVAPTVSSLPAQTINAVITISDSDTGSTVQSKQITVTITISSPAAIVQVSMNSMSFSHTSSITNSTQPLSITNTGSAPLNWLITQSPSASWLTILNTSGTLAPGANIAVDITCDSSKLSPGSSYSTTLIVSDSDQGSKVVSQTINVTVTVT